MPLTQILAIFSENDDIYFHQISIFIWWHLYYLFYQYYLILQKYALFVTIFRKPMLRKSAPCIRCFWQVRPNWTTFLLLAWTNCCSRCWLHWWTWTGDIFDKNFYFQRNGDFFYKSLSLGNVSKLTRFLFPTRKKRNLFNIHVNNTESRTFTRETFPGLISLFL